MSLSSALVEIGIILALVALNGVLALSELAIVSARRARLQQRAQEGHRGAKAALGLAANPTRFLSTVQIGITLVGVLAGAFAGATIADELGDVLDRVRWIAPWGDAIAVAAVVTAVTYVSLVVGELVPKRIALAAPERVAAAVARPMEWVSWLAGPLVTVLGASTEAVLKLFPAPPREDSAAEEEIKVLLTEGARSGVFQAAETRLVESVFRFADLRVDALMTPRSDLVALDVADPADVVAAKTVESKHSVFPVTDGGLEQVIGVVRAKDILARSLRSEALDLRAVMREALYVPESVPVLRVLDLFRQSDQHVAIVIDEYGGVQGMVTHNHILEAIVGDLPGIGDPFEKPAIRRDDGSWLLDGMLRTGELKEILGVRELPGEESHGYQTLGGFVMARMGRIPTSAQWFEWDGWRFEVVDMDGLRIDKVLVRKVGPPPAKPRGRGAAPVPAPAA